MYGLVHLSLLLAAFSALVSAGPVSSLTKATAYNNCSGDYPNQLPNDVDSTPYYKPQIHVKPEDLLKNGSGWEEWRFLASNIFPDGSELIYGYNWGLGDPTSANYSHQSFTAFAYFPNGSYIREIGHGPFSYQDNPDGGFTISVLDSYLTWDPVNDHWNATINSSGYVVETLTKNQSPFIPYAPNYQGENGQISEGFFSRIDTPRGYTTGKISFPWGLEYDVQSVGTFKHTWSYDIMADAISAYVRGSTYLPGVATVNWYQAWDNSGKEVDSLQLLVELDGSDDQVLRYQATDDETLSIVTTPKPVGLPLSYQNTEITLPLCAPGADYSGDKLIWKTNNVLQYDDFIDFSNGSTIYQTVNITAHLWIGGKAVDIDGGFGLVEVYHRF